MGLEIESKVRSQFSRVPIGVQGVPQGFSQIRLHRIVGPKVASTLEKQLQMGPKLVSRLETTLASTFKMTFELVIIFGTHFEMQSSLESALGPNLHFGRLWQAHGLWDQGTSNRIAHHKHRLTWCA